MGLSWWVLRIVIWSDRTGTDPCRHRVENKERAARIVGRRKNRFINFGLMRKACESLRRILGTMYLLVLSLRTQPQMPARAKQTDLDPDPN